MKYIEDPGHAWLEISKRDVIKSGVEISHYSYENPRTGMAYLEEDCDAPAFLQAIGKFRNKDGSLVNYPEEYQGKTFIRDLPPFSMCV